MTTELKPLNQTQIDALKTINSGKGRVNHNTAKALDARGLITITWEGYSGREYVLTLDGQETLRALTNTQPVIENTPSFIPSLGEYAMHGDRCVKVVSQDDEGWYRIVFFNERLNTHQTYRLEASDLSPVVFDPRDARIAELEAQVKALQAQIAELSASDNDDENEMTLDEAREKLPTGSHAYYEGKRVLILETSMYGTERRISSDNEELWVKVWDLKKTKAE
jgi:hypothetical protein